MASFSFLDDAKIALQKYDIVSVSRRHPESIVIGYDRWRQLMSNTYQPMSENS